MKCNRPNYKLIYKDLIELKFPEKMEICSAHLNKKGDLSVAEILLLDELLFPKNKRNNVNQKFKSYDKKAILKILDYKTQNNLNNTEIALKFNISRNTIAKWLKDFQRVYN